MSKLITQSTLTVNGVDLKTPRLIEPPPRVTIGKKPEHITVVCVWWGTLYPKTYVEKLRDSVARNLSIPHTFVCITDRDDVPEGVVKVAPQIPGAVSTGKNSYGDGKGWWQKVGLFAPGLLNGRVLYMDLDVVVTGSLDSIASVEQPFCMIENYGPNKAHAAHNSSVMVWTPSEKTEQIFTKFSPDVTNELHGDQCWIWRVMRDEIHNYPKSWVVSYKYEKHPQWRHTNNETAVVVFHGKPKPHEVLNDPLVKNNWK